MKSNIKRLSFCLSALMLLILASPLTVLAAEEEVAASAKFYGTFWSLVPPLVGTDHQRSIQFTVCRNTGWCTVLL